MKFRLRLVTILLAAVLLLIFYHPVIFHPSAFVFDTDGDGLKSWYVMKYQVQDPSTGFKEFKGMNYPFTESIYHMDAQPGILFFFKWINSNCFDITGNFTNIIYYLVFLSLLISSFFILEILFHYGMVSWLAVLFATGITFMAPQLHRIGSHISLAYACVLPMVWWLYLNWSRQQKKYFLFLLIFVLIFSGLIHPYYIVLSAILLFILVLIERKFTLREKLKNFFVLIIVPFSLFFIIMNAGYRGSTDLAKLPYGAFGESYRSRPEDVFTPNEWSFWYDFLHLHWIHHGSWEGEAFVGFAMLIPGISYLFYFLASVSRNKKRKKLNPFKTLAGLFLFPMLLFIITAGAFYFILPVSVKILFPAFLTQFRSIGRIAWVIFYMLSIFFSVKYFQWLRLNSIKKRKAAWLISFLMFFFLFAADVIETNLRVASGLNSKKVSFLNPHIGMLAGNINPVNYQAIIALPYFHFVNSLPVERVAFPGASNPAFNLSLQTMLPLTDMNASRTSQGLALKQLRLYTENDKEILKYYPNQKPLLIVTTKEYMDQILDGTIVNADLFKYEKKILQAAKFLNQADNYLLFEIQYKELLLMH